MEFDALSRKRFVTAWRKVVGTQFPR